MLTIHSLPGDPFGNTSLTPLETWKLLRFYWGILIVVDSIMKRRVAGSFPSASLLTSIICFLKHVSKTSLLWVSISLGPTSGSKIWSPSRWIELLWMIFEWNLSHFLIIKLTSQRTLITPPLLFSLNTHFPSKRDSNSRMTRPNFLTLKLPLLLLGANTFRGTLYVFNVKLKLLRQCLSTKVGSRTPFLRKGSSSLRAINPWFIKHQLEL